MSVPGSLSIASFEADELTDALGTRDFDDKSWAAVASKHMDSISSLHRVMTSIGDAVTKVANNTHGGL